MMEEHLSEVTHWFNHVFGPAALRLLHALHIQPKDFDRPIPEYVVMSLIVLIFCTILALILRPQLSVERPGAMQQIAELLLKKTLGMKRIALSPSPAPFRSSFSFQTC
jgi:hypothetical protein